MSDMDAVARLAKAHLPVGEELLRDPSSRRMIRDRLRKQLGRLGRVAGPLFWFEMTDMDDIYRALFSDWQPRSAERPRRYDVSAHALVFFRTDQPGSRRQ